MNVSSANKNIPKVQERINMKKTSIRYIEELSFNAHPSLQTQYYDGWVLRFANGYSSRANSVNAIYPSTIDLIEKIEECEKRYFENNLSCIFKVTDENAKMLDGILDDRGYDVVTPTDVMILDMTDKQFILGDCIITEKVTDEWLETYFTLEKYTNQSTRDTVTQICNVIQNDTLYCIIKMDGTNVACASAVIESGYVYIANVIVDEMYRGNGYGRRLCETLLAKAKEIGGHTAYLQVIQTNGIAISLYEKLGFEKMYSYWYRVKNNSKNMY